MEIARRKFTCRFARAFGLLVIGATTLAAVGADDPPTRASPDAPAADYSRLFRFHAGVQAEALNAALDRAAFDEGSRNDLRSLVRDYLRRVDEEAAKPAAAAPLDELIDRAAGMARDFNDKRVAAWLDDHPAAFQPVQEQIALAEAVQRSVAEDPDALVRAARTAGLPAEREADLRRGLSEARERLARADDAAQKAIRDAAEEAGLPPPPPPGPPPKDGARSARLDDRGPGRDPAPRPGRPRDDAPPATRGDPPLRRLDEPRDPAAASNPPSPAAQKVQLMDALALVDAQTRLMAAGRDARAEVEKLLPEPARLKTFSNEMLRGYQAAQQPPDNRTRDAAPGAAEPRDRPK